MDETITESVKKYKNRLRVFLILLIFGENTSREEESQYAKVFHTEVRLQKLHFLLRNPDYLAYELLTLASKESQYRDEIKNIVEHIFRDEEPSLRKEAMERFFYGAYEDLDDVIAFLISLGFLSFKSSKNSSLNTVEKKYYVTQFAVKKTQDSLKKLPSIQWYVERCNLIKKYFGHLSGSQLKASQYQIEEYRDASYREYIGGVKEKTRLMFNDLYGEEIA